MQTKRVMGGKQTIDHILAKQGKNGAKNFEATRLGASSKLGQRNKETRRTDQAVRRAVKKPRRQALLKSY